MPTIAQNAPTEYATESPPELPITIISPHRGWFEWRLRQLWRYRDLIGLFIWRDFVAIYKQTILGPTWHIIRPLIATLIFTVVFGRMARLSTDGAPAFLFYMSGFVLWSYFAICLDNVSRTFIANAPLMGKVYFHRLVIPVSLILSNLIAFLIQFAIFLIVLAGYWVTGTPVDITRWIFVTPLILIVVAGYALAAGLVVCAVTTRYRDLTYLVSFGIQFLMYLTPVIYPISSLSPGYRRLIMINPLTPLIEGFRKAFLGIGTVAPSEVAMSAAVMFALLVIALMVFSRSERTFMDTV